MWKNILTNVFSCSLRYQSIFLPVTLFLFCLLWLQVYKNLWNNKKTFQPLTQLCKPPVWDSCPLDYKPPPIFSPLSPEIIWEHIHLVFRMFWKEGRPRHVFSLQTQKGQLETPSTVHWHCVKISDWGLKQQILISYSSGGWQVQGQGVGWFHDLPLPLLEDTNLSTRAPPSQRHLTLTTSQRPLPPYAIHWELGLPHTNSGNTIQSMAAP